MHGTSAYSNEMNPHRKNLLVKVKPNLGYVLFCEQQFEGIIGLILKTIQYF